MKFAIMAWVSSQARHASIFGVLDKDKPRQLPMLGPQGHWIDYRTIDESRFVFAAEAKQSIAANGFYLMGASVTIEQAFGSPPT
jgi:hypothetical protein